MERLKGISFTVSSNTLEELTVTGVDQDGDVAIQGVVTISQASSPSVNHKFNGVIWGHKANGAMGGDLINCINNAFCMHETEMFYEGQE